MLLVEIFIWGVGGMPQRKYWEAYDDRYRQIHEQGLQWFAINPSPIVAETLCEFSVLPQHKLLEIGCGEGRDACPLLKQGYDLLATDVSSQAIAFCRKRMPEYAGNFQILDCVTQRLRGTFDFIYAVAVVHMLVPDADRDAFYEFIREHLKPAGIALICTMGDGHSERQTDIRTAFDMQARIHGQTGKAVQVAGTSFRMVNFQTFEQELKRNGLMALKQGITAVEPDFPQMMYAVVRVR